MPKNKKIKPEEALNTDYAPQNKNFFYKIELKCKNQKQKNFLKLLKDKKKEICFGVGSAGSGKTYVSIAYALQAIKENNKYKKLIVIPPTVEAGSRDLHLGFLSGDKIMKQEPYCDNVYSLIEDIISKSGNNEPKKLARNIINEYVEIELVNFARGKTWSNCIIDIEEAENFSKKEMLLLLTRIGENCKVIINGDAAQKDRRYLNNEDDGMTYYSNALSDLEEVGCVEFTNDDIVRNPLIQKIIDRS